MGVIDLEMGPVLTPALGPTPLTFLTQTVVRRPALNGTKLMLCVLRFSSQHVAESIPLRLS